ncbi:receptor-like protein 12 [Durio zibethinus]|uniref:Receptor-like protein 12 n=1 Tax=Durio zibethinus TaxID=66656 RepID=A0A6P5WPW6_DURZI|nr:receptor-like protein 12 [Durio zibethinus]
MSILTDEVNIALRMNTGSVQLDIPPGSRAWYTGYENCCGRISCMGWACCGPKPGGYKGLTTSCDGRPYWLKTALPCSNSRTPFPLMILALVSVLTLSLLIQKQTPGMKAQTAAHGMESLATRTGHVTGLNLSCSFLVGSFSENSSLFRLQGLKRLNLAYNTNSMVLSLLGLVIPSDISLLSKLISLDLSENSYWELEFDSRSFDKLMHNLSDLENLFLGIVNMSDVLPSSLINLTSSLKRLGLGESELQGEFPTEIFNLPYLEYLDLSSNYFLTGYLPRSNWSSPLRFLDLSSSGFKGSIPSALGNLTKITFLSLSHFEGELPNVFGNLNKLTTLDFDYCNFSGQLPPTLFNLTQLTHLDLSFNSLEGPLPTQISGLQNLYEFRLTDNLLSGAIPSWLFTLPSLEYLDLGSNSLTGPINQIQKPNSVQQVFLANNDIHGEIPSSFFDLANLAQLDLSSNNLTGVIKSAMLSKLGNLEKLDLSSNNFCGVIKLDLLSKLKNLTTLDLSNNRLLSLSSSIGVNYSFQELQTFSFSSCNVRQFPNFLRTAKQLRVLDLSFNKIHGSISKWESEGWEELSSLNLSYNSLISLEQFPGKNLEILDLRSNKLRGHLPDPPSSLRECLMSKNQLTGKIPPSICNMTSLEILDLSTNNLSGIIPACLGNLRFSISTINLQKNNFHGKIPDCFVWGTRLTNLALNDNQLEGLLPRSLINCTSLRFLNLANNKLKDTFPHWLDNLPNLHFLILRSNRLHGPFNISKVPSSFSSLQIIDLSQNEFGGPLPTKFFQSLEAMKDESEAMTGVLTRAIGCKNIFVRSCSEATSYGNHGPEITTIANFVKVTMKRLEIELQLEKTLPGFTLIDFSNNRFSGRIPDALGELHALLVLNLSHNNLNGSIPSSFRSMAAIESLDLSWNKLSGRIPSQLTNLTFLEVLNLSQNNLIGPIPHGKQFDTFDNDSYSGNLALCGLPLSKKCGNGDGPKPPTPVFVEDEGSAIPFIWELAMMGYGCGLVLGLSMGYIVFTTGRPWWFVRTIERDWQNGNRTEFEEDMHPASLGPGWKGLLTFLV